MRSCDGRRHRVDRQPRRRDRLGGRAARSPGDRLRARAGERDQAGAHRAARRRDPARGRRHGRGEGARPGRGGGSRLCRSSRTAPSLRSTRATRRSATRSSTSSARRQQPSSSPSGTARSSAGSARAVKTRSPETLRIGVVAAAAPVMADSWAAGRAVPSEESADLCRRARRAGRDPLRRGRPRTMSPRTCSASNETEIARGRARLCRCRDPRRGCRRRRRSPHSRSSRSSTARSS